MIGEETERNDLTRFEKFKKWAKENITGVSAVAISVAGIITAAVMTGRNALKMLIQTPFTYRLCSKTPTQSLGLKTILGDLCKELQIRIGSSPVNDNKLENLIMVNKDLWLPDERREDISEYGIATSSETHVRR